MKGKKFNTEEKIRKLHPASLCRLSFNGHR